MWIRLLAFLVLNFAALGLGGLATNSGVTSDWYDALNKAPWTPPGWVFGAAWTIIMICFAIYMAFLWGKVENKNKLVALFGIQWVLNIIWNPIFFHYHQVSIAFVVIVSLTLVVFLLQMLFVKVMKIKTILIVPYIVWLLIATSLNLYVLLYN